MNRPNPSRPPRRPSPARPPQPRPAQSRTTQPRHPAGQPPRRGAPPARPRPPVQHLKQARPSPDIRRRAPARDPARVMRMYLARFLIFIFVFILLSLTVVVGFFLNLTSAVRPASIAYVFHSDSGKDEVVVPYDIAFYNGVQYLPFIRFAEYFNFTLSGDINDHTFISRDSGDFITFSTNSTAVVINSARINMDSPTRFYGGELYVPLDGVSRIMRGISCTVSIDSKFTYDLVRSTTEAKVTFALKDDAPIEVLDELKLFGEVYMPVVFKSDLSGYSQYFAPKNPSQYLLLVNKTHPLAAEFVPEDLIDVVDTRKDGRPTQKMCEIPAKALEGMMIEARANGHTQITVTSGYRDYYSQQATLDTQIKELTPSFGDKAEEEALKTVNRPGQSEHQTGLCVDISAPGFAGTGFGKSAAGTWLANNAHYFGFILRYPEGKTDITGINYEPWHFRYVGRYHATRMYELKLTLEEYIDYINSGEKSAA